MFHKPTHQLKQSNKIRPGQVTFFVKLICKIYSELNKFKLNKFLNLNKNAVIHLAHCCHKINMWLKLKPKKIKLWIQAQRKYKSTTKKSRIKVGHYKQFLG